MQLALIPVSLLCRVDERPPPPPACLPPPIDIPLSLSIWLFAKHNQPRLDVSNFAQHTAVPVEIRARTNRDPGRNGHRDTQRQPFALHGAPARQRPRGD